jgi:hypothetical protein
MKKFIAATAVLVALAGLGAGAVSSTAVDDARNSLKKIIATSSTKG